MDWQQLSEKNNPHLMDIAGDTVHTVATAAKVMFKPFHGFIENISSDFYYDLDNSPKAKDLFMEIQTILFGMDEKALRIIRPCPSRFLQMMQVTDRLSSLMDALRLYYFAFLTDAEKKQYKHVVQDIISRHNVDEGGAARICVIQTGQAKQAKSSTNESRKDRILTLLFKDFQQFRVMVDLYRGLLRKFELYTKLFQSEKPTVHLLHSQMFSVVRKILTLFLKREHIPETVKEMMKLKGNLGRESQVSDAELCVGEFSYNGYKTALKDSKSQYWVKQLVAHLREGYVNSTEMLLGRLPLKNSTLIRLSCLDPKASNEECTKSSLRKLGERLPNVVPLSDQGGFDTEVREYIIDLDVQSLASKYDHSSGRVDADFWTKVFNLKTGTSVRYPILSKLVKALLSVFSGPLVESSFNLMDDCIRTDRTKLLVQNYEASAVIKSALCNRQANACTFDISAEIIHCIKTSKARHVKQVELRKKKKKEGQDERNRKAIENLSKLNSKSSRPKVIRCTPGDRHLVSSSCATNQPARSTTCSSTVTTGAPGSAVASETPDPVTSSSSHHSQSRSKEPGAAATHPSQPKNTMPKGGKRAAVKNSQDIRGFFKKPRLE